MKRIYTAISFFSVLGILFFGNIIAPDRKSSEILKKDLAQFPEISVQNIFNGKFSKGLNDYTKDQQFGSEFMSNIVANVNYKVLGMKLNKGILEDDGHLYKLITSVNDLNVNTFSNNINKYFKMFDNKSRVVVIPSKSMYLDDSYLHLTNEAYQDLPFEFIDTFDVLNKDSYYKTDMHLNNTGAYDLYKFLIKELGYEPIDVKFETVSTDFQGIYATTSMYLTLKDDILKPTNDLLDNLKVSTMNQAGKFIEHTGAYFDKHLEKMDKYSYMLDGNKPVQIIENENGNGKELVLVKDSYSLALAPYLAMNYSKVTLLDFRVIMPQMAADFISEDAEILYIYGFEAFNAGRVNQ